MTYVPTQPVDIIPDDIELPSSVHPAAAAWRALDERDVDAEMGLAECHSAIADGRVKDKIAADRAVDAGKPVPVPQDKFERAAFDALAAKDTELLLIRQRKAKAGEVYVAALTTARDEYAAMTAGAVTVAADAYTVAVDAAEALVSGPANALEIATAGLSTIGSIDGGAPYGLASTTLQIERPSFVAARTSTNVARALAAQSFEPEERIAIRTTAGDVIVFPAADALGVIAAGGVRVAPDEIPDDAVQIGAQVS